MGSSRELEIYIQMKCFGLQKSTQKNRLKYSWKKFKKMFRDETAFRKGIDFGGDSMSDYRNILEKRKISKQAQRLREKQRDL